jgi:hypothetical protein
MLLETCLPRVPAGITLPIERITQEESVKDMIGSEWPEPLWDAPNARVIPATPALTEAATGLSAELNRIYVKALVALSATASAALKEMEAPIAEYGRRIAEQLRGLDTSLLKRQRLEDLPEGHPAKKILQREVEDEEEYEESESDSGEDESGSGEEQSGSSEEEGSGSDEDSEE